MLCYGFFLTHSRSLSLSNSVSLPFRLQCSVVGFTKLIRINTKYTKQRAAQINAHGRNQAVDKIRSKKKKVYEHLVKNKNEIHQTNRCLLELKIVSEWLRYTHQLIMDKWIG